MWGGKGCQERKEGNERGVTALSSRREKAEDVRGKSLSRPVLLTKRLCYPKRKEKRVRQEGKERGKHTVKKIEPRVRNGSER